MLLALAGCNAGAQNDTSTAVSDTSTNMAGPAPASLTDPAQPVRAFVRAVHTVRGAGPVALAIDGEKVVNDLTFGNVSSFIGVSGDKIKIHSTTPHQITAVGADGKTLGGAMALDLERGEDITVVIGGAPGKITLTPFEHTNRGSARDAAKIAVLHADKALPEIGVAVDGKNWTGDIGYGEVTGYKQVAPGAHTLKVMSDKSQVGIVDIDLKPGSAPPPFTVRKTDLITMTQPLDLQADKVYSVILYEDANGLPRLRFLEDKFEPALVRAADAQ